jgi:hypothetical protein
MFPDSLFSVLCGMVEMLLFFYFIVGLGFHRVVLAIFIGICFGHKLFWLAVIGFVFWASVRLAGPFLKLIRKR